VTFSVASAIVTVADTSITELILAGMHLYQGNNTLAISTSVNEVGGLWYLACLSVCAQDIS